MPCKRNLPPEPPKPYNPASMRQEVRDLIGKHPVLAPIADRILAELSVGLHLVEDPSRQEELGRSRLGGLPDVDEDFQWPRFEGRPLGFLAQINCAETKRVDPDHVLPASGILHFFYDEESSSEIDSEGNQAAVVLYTTSSSLRTAPAPPGLNRDYIRPAYPIAFFPSATLPVPLLDIEQNPASYNLLRLSDEQASAYMKVVRSLPGKHGLGPAHFLLGQAIPVSDNEMQQECEIRTSGMSYNDPALDEEPMRGELQRRAAEWRLLLQLDTDDDLNTDWCGGGTLYFWIRREDLQRRDFGAVWPMIQCT